ncbi:MAG: flagellar brake protein [Thermodesulfobacteriota bacterium]
MSKKMEKPELALDVGAPLLVEVAGQGVHYKSAFVGAVSREYLILKLRVDDLAAVGSTCDVPVNVSYMHGGEVHAFGSRIISAISTPSPLIFVEYPGVVQVRDSRTCHRYDCMLPARTCIGKTCVEAIVIDLSKEGCRYSVKTDDAESVRGLDGLLGLNSDASLKVLMPGKEREIELKGIVRNISTDNERTVFGISFCGMPDEAKGDIETLLSAVRSC